MKRVLIVFLAVIVVACAAGSSSEWKFVKGSAMDLDVGPPFVVKETIYHTSGQVFGYLAEAPADFVNQWIELLQKEEGAAVKYSENKREVYFPDKADDGSTVFNHLLIWPAENGNFFVVHLVGQQRRLDPGIFAFLANHKG